MKQNLKLPDYFDVKVNFSHIYRPHLLLIQWHLCRIHSNWHNSHFQVLYHTIDVQICTKYDIDWSRRINDYVGRRSGHKLDCPINIKTNVIVSTQQRTVIAFSSVSSIFASVKLSVVALTVCQLAIANIAAEDTQKWHMMWGASLLTHIIRWLYQWIFWVGL